jgi:hypothetical protein
MIGATSGTGTAHLSGASELLVMFVLLNLLFCMSCFVDHCFYFHLFSFHSIYGNLLRQWHLQTFQN